MDQSNSTEYFLAPQPLLVEFVFVYPVLAFLNENKIEVGQIESTVINIVFEFWKRSQSDEPFEPSKTFVKFNPYWYESIWGKDLCGRVAEKASPSTTALHCQN